MPSFPLRIVMLLTAFFTVTTSFSQSNWKNWDGVSLDLGLTKKVELGINHLRSYDIPGFQNNFNQWGLNVDYDFNKKFSGKAGLTFTNFTADTVTTNRLWIRGTYKIPIGEEISWSNGLQAERHSASESRFNYRLIYQTRLATRHRLAFLRIAPSISYWLYYNIGGNTIQYYDESGSPLVRETPDGIHRGRFTVNLNSKITNNVSVGVYYLNQHEFNLAGRDVNVTNPSTGKVARPFNDYQVAGLSLAFSFDVYEKKHPKNKSKTTKSKL